MKRRLMEVQVNLSQFKNPQQFAQAIQNGMLGVAEAIRADFKATTITWKHKPRFEKRTKGFADIEIVTDDKIWIMLNYGTKPHLILPKPTNKSQRLRFRWDGFGSYKAKTKPNFLGSKGATYPKTLVSRRMVRHPGTKARNWIVTAQTKWNKLMPARIQNAIDSVAKRGG